MSSTRKRELPYWLILVPILIGLLLDVFDVGKQAWSLASLINPAPPRLSQHYYLLETQNVEGLSEDFTLEDVSRVYAERMKEFSLSIATPDFMQDYVKQFGAMEEKAIAAFCEGRGAEIADCAGSATARAYVALYGVKNEEDKALQDFEFEFLKYDLPQGAATSLDLIVFHSPEKPECLWSSLEEDCDFVKGVAPTTSRVRIVQTLAGGHMLALPIYVSWAVSVSGPDGSASEYDGIVLSPLYLPKSVTVGGQEAIPVARPMSSVPLHISAPGVEGRG